MLTEQRKLLISAYIDGETSPDETERVRQLLERSKTARDYFQGQLLIARRVRQALSLDPSQKQFETNDVLREIFSRPAAVSLGTSPSGLRKPMWVAMALTCGIALCAGFGAFFPYGFSFDRMDRNHEAGLEKAVLQEELWIASGQQAHEMFANDPLDESLPAKITLPDLPNNLATQKNLSDSGVLSLQGKKSDSAKTTVPLGEIENEMNQSEILASPSGPSHFLKRIDLVLPSILKAKALDQNVLEDWELKGIVRLDLPTFQENEAIKRLMETLKAEGCGAFLDPVVADKIKRNVSVGPVNIVVHGLDSGNICRVIQGTCKTGLNKNSPNQPISVFDEVIVCNLSIREGEELLGTLHRNANVSGTFRKPVESDGLSKSSRTKSPKAAFATISSANAIRITGVVPPRRTSGKTAFDSVKPPVVLNIVPLK